MIAAGAAALAVARGPRRSVVTRMLARSPLRLLAPRNAGDAAWVYAATLGGGVLPGDHLALELTVGSGATAFVGTQSQTKVFRSDAGARAARQETRVAVDDGGLLVWAPDPVAPFAGARWEQRLEVDLTGGSVVLVDGLTAGRAARGERWAFARFAARTRVSAGGELLVDDGLVLDERHGPLAPRLGAAGALATVMVFGPRATPVADALRRVARARPLRADPRVSCSDVAGGGVVARVAGGAVDAVGAVVRQLLAAVPALLGDDPFARKW